MHEEHIILIISNLLTKKYIFFIYFSLILYIILIFIANYLFASDYIHKFVLIQIIRAWTQHY